MGNACKGIIIGSGASCSNPLKASVSERLLIGNLADIVSVDYNTVNTSVIENINMKAGTSLHVFQGIRSSNKPEINLQVDDVSVNFIHQVDFSVFNVDSAQKENLQGMASVKTFAIYQNPKDSSLGDAVWEALGINSGLEMSQLVRLPASKDGAYKIQLKTPDAAGETGLPNSVWDTDVLTTEAMLAGITSTGNFSVSTAVATDVGGVVINFLSTGTVPAPITMTGANAVAIGGTVTHSPDTITVNTPASGVTVSVLGLITPGDTVLVSGDFTDSNGDTLTLSNYSIIAT